jgi:hypothetical protein
MREDGDYQLGGGCGKDLLMLPFWLIGLAVVVLFKWMRGVR